MGREGAGARGGGGAGARGRGGPGGDSHLPRPAPPLPAGVAFFPFFLFPSGRGARGPRGPGPHTGAFLGAAVRVSPQGPGDPRPELTREMD